MGSGLGASAMIPPARRVVEDLHDDAEAPETRDLGRVQPRLAQHLAIAEAAFAGGKARIGCQRGPPDRSAEGLPELVDPHGDVDPAVPGWESLGRDDVRVRAAGAGAGPARGGG